MGPVFISHKLMPIDWERNKKMQVFSGLCCVTRRAIMSHHVSVRSFAPVLCRVLGAAIVAGWPALRPTEAQGQTAAAVNVTIQAIPNPVSLGSNVTISAMGNPTSPQNPSCEITITNVIWSWSTSFGGTFGDSANPSWTIQATSCGSNSISITGTVTFVGTDCNGPYSTNVTATTNGSFTVVVCQPPIGHRFTARD